MECYHRSNSAISNHLVDCSVIHLKLPAWQATSVAAIGSFIIAITAFQADPFIMVTGALEGAALAIPGQSYGLLQLLSSFITW